MQFGQMAPDAGFTPSDPDPGYCVPMLGEQGHDQKRVGEKKPDTRETVRPSAGLSL